jgi:hypothetical protein
VCKCNRRARREGAEVAERLATFASSVNTFATSAVTLGGGSAAR